MTTTRCYYEIAVERFRRGEEVDFIEAVGECPCVACYGFRSHP